MLSAAAPERLSRQRAEEFRPCYPDRQQRSEQQYDVDRYAPFALPIDIAQVQPQREFVERQRRARAVQKRHEPAGPARPCTHVRADLQQPSISDDEQQQDSPDEVVNVPSADGEIVERAAAGADGMRQNPDDCKRQVERDGGYELAFAMGMRKVLAIDVADPCGAAANRRAEDKQADGERRENNERDAGWMQHERGEHAFRLPCTYAAATAACASSHCSHALIPCLLLDESRTISMSGCTDRAFASASSVLERHVRQQVDFSQHHERRIEEDARILQRLLLAFGDAQQRRSCAPRPDRSWSGRPGCRRSR